MGVGKCKVCESNDITVSMFGSGVLIYCNSCGLRVKGLDLEEAEEKWNNLKIVSVGSDGLAGKRIPVSTAMLLSPLAMFDSPVMENPLAKMMRKKEPKQMGPGAGTSRQRRASKGQKW